MWGSGKLFRWRRFDELDGTRRYNMRHYRTMRRFCWFTGFLLLLSSPLLGQGEVRFELRAPTDPVTAGDGLTVIVEADVASGWHLYSMHVAEGGPIPTTITVTETPSFASGGDPVEPEPKKWFDENFGMETNYFEGRVDFEVPVAVASDSPIGPQSLEIRIRYMICNDTQCLPPQTVPLTATVEVVGGSGEAVATAVTAAVPVPPAATSDAPVAVTGVAGLPAGLFAYLWFAFGAGALALLTPCVFPMIPITVSYFTKREAATRQRAVTEAGIYSLGIIATFTVLGLALTLAFGAGGINRLAASPTVNLFIAAVFIVFALSLFGVIELRLPNSWLNTVNRGASERSGITGILLMALTFSLTSFTCTVPFVGTVMVAALHGDVLWSMLGVTAFATAFALPFFVLALFPSWLQALPKSGNWMNSVKIVMGFLELAAALKFISNVDLVFQWELITRPVFITVWLSIALLTTAYLLGWFRFAHEMASESIGASRVLFAVFFLSVSFYLLRGLIGFPLGELDAFLPPRGYGEIGGIAGLLASSGRQGEEEAWLESYEEGLALARAEGRPMFIDFTGYTCTNCRWMESNVFPQADVQSLFESYVLVRLYTDGTKPEHTWNQNFERERFGTIALPFYALLSPNEETLGTFPGLTRDRSEFVRFLKDGLGESDRLSLASGR